MSTMRRPLLYSSVGLAALAVICGFQRQLSPATQVKQISAVVNVKSLALAMNAYAEDADGVYPYAPNLKTLKVVTLPYVKDKALWKTENPKSEIRFNSALGGVLSKSIESPKTTVFFYESKSWPDDTRAVSFVDGNARLLSAHEWAQSASTLLPKDLKRVAVPLADLSKQWKD